MDTTKEQALLKISILMTLLIALVGISFGLWSGSRAIVFDGLYSLIDASMTCISLLVSRLLVREGSRRFQYGYWHLEPLVIASNGTVLSGACTYAFIDGLGDVLAGGHSIQFGDGAIYALLAAAVSYAMAFYIHRQSRVLNSELLRVDARAWLIGGSLSAGLCISFAAGFLLAESGSAQWARYLDPAVLMTLALLLIPIPLTTVWRALRDIFGVAPSDLDIHVRRVMSKVAAEQGFRTYSSYVQKTGRARFIEIHIVTPADYRVESVRQLDRIREDIAGRIGLGGPETWLTIAFTTDEKWI
jgi:predicted Co/Zn/Cd cation transporter (cation efflux family)